MTTTNYADSEEYREARAYLLDGGYGEVVGLALASLEVGAPKVQMDTAMALALLDMAAPIATYNPEPSYSGHETRPLIPFAGRVHTPRHPLLAGTEERSRPPALTPICAASAALF